jgi:hypothetical protein
MKTNEQFARKTVVLYISLRRGKYWQRFFSITENTKEVKVTQNWVEFVVRRSAESYIGIFLFVVLFTQR